MKSTFFDNIKSEITNALKTTKNEVRAMLAWFTDEEISKILIDLARNGIKISIILSNSEWNLLNRKNFEILLDTENAEIRSYGSISPADGDFMHRKLCIIDNMIVINGSYNWTKNATRNQEDLCINFDEKDAENCLNEFNKLWDKSQLIDFENIQINSKRTIEELIEFEEKGITPEQYHNELITENIVSQNEEKSTVYEPEIAIKEKQEIDSRNNNSIFDITRSEQVYDPDKLYVYNERLLIWGVESVNIWLKLKFEVNNEIIDISVTTSDFKDVLLKNKELFLVWNKFGKKFPLTLFNCLNPCIGLEAPILFSIQTTKGSRPRLKLILKKNDSVCQKIFHNKDLDYFLKNSDFSMGYF